MFDEEVIIFDEEIIDLQKEAEKYSYILIDFKREWFNYSFNAFEWPSLRYKKITKEFIILVHPSGRKVQYLPFVYKNIKTELHL
jgi:hypothetical protein